MSEKIARSAPRNQAWIWVFASLLAAALVAAPVFALLASFAAPAEETWVHLGGTVLLSYFLNTLALALIVAVLALVMGVSTAWLTAATEFPGRRVFAWLLVAPLAAPAYVIAYVYTDLLEFAGPVQTFIREATGWRASEYWFPQIRSLPGAALMLALVLYPYVYLLARADFLRRSTALFEAARMLGASPRRAFLQIVLPTARPAIAGGLALAMMETVADYGVVDYFGVSTFSTGIFRTWFGLGEPEAASQLAGLMFLFVAALIVFESASRRGRSAHSGARDRVGERMPLRGGHVLLALAICTAPIAFGFLIPVGVLLAMTLEGGDQLLGQGYFEFVANSFTASGLAALAATILAVLLAYSARLNPHPLNKVAIRIGALGYALPGALLAVGLLAPLTQLDLFINRVAAAQFDARPGLVLTGTIAALIFAYVARFLTVAFNTCQGGLEKISPNLDAAARSLGAPPNRVLAQIHLPLMRASVLSAGLLVFVDVMKELPATLLLRPFNFDTLATRVYRLASDERLSEASTAALTLIAISLAPAILLSLQIARSDRRDDTA